MCAVAIFRKCYERGTDISLLGGGGGGVKCNHGVSLSDNNYNVTFLFRCDPSTVQIKDNCSLTAEELSKHTGVSIMLASERYARRE